MRSFGFALFFACFCTSSIFGEDGNSVIVENVQKPVLVFEETEINLGSIPVDQDIISGQIGFANLGKEVLIIEKVHGPCSCFMGWDGDKQVKPGEGGAINFRFDKNKIQAGQVIREVHVFSNDPNNKKAVVRVKFNVERDPLEEEVRLLRLEVASMKKELRSFRAEMKKMLSVSNTKPTAKLVDKTVYEVPVGNSPTLGTKDAPVTITEFVDLQCPYCVREFTKIKEILKAYEGQVQVVFKHYPLSFHKKAKPAHALVELALQQKGNDGFWKIHDMILAEPKKLDIDDLRVYAEKVGLDMDNFEKTMADESAIKKLLADDKALATKCGVRSTPTVMVNGLKLVDRSIQGYKNRIDEILSEKY